MLMREKGGLKRWALEIKLEGRAGGGDGWRGAVQKPVVAELERCRTTRLVVRSQDA